MDLTSKHGHLKSPSVILKATNELKMLRNYSTRGAWLNLQLGSPRWREDVSFTSPAGEVFGLASDFSAKRLNV